MSFSQGIDRSLSRLGLVLKSCLYWVKWMTNPHFKIVSNMKTKIFSLLFDFYLTFIYLFRIFVYLKVCLHNAITFSSSTSETNNTLLIWWQNTYPVFPALTLGLLWFYSLAIICEEKPHWEPLKKVTRAKLLEDSQTSFSLVVTRQ